MNTEELEVYVDKFRRERIGLESQPETVQIEAGAIRKFARSIGETNPLHLDKAYAKTTRHGGIIAPPTFPSCLIQTVMVGLAGVIEELSHILHTDDIVDNFLPIKAGDEITSTARYADVFQRQGPSGPMLFQAMDVTQVNQHAQRVAVVRMVTVRY
jgi:acyl dehydratase